MYIYGRYVLKLLILLIIIVLREINCNSKSSKSPTLYNKMWIIQDIISILVYSLSIKAWFLKNDKLEALQILIKFKKRKNQENNKALKKEKSRKFLTKFSFLYFQQTVFTKKAISSNTLYMEYICRFIEKSVEKN